MPVQFFCIRPGPAFERSHGRWKHVTLPKAVCGQARSGFIRGGWGGMSVAVIKVRGKEYAVRPGKSLFAPKRGLSGAGRRRRRAR